MSPTIKAPIRHPASRAMVIVLGMHRSGTSALCGALDLLGVNFGGDLMPGSEANEKGYWEHPEIRSLHDQLLNSFGSSWHDDRSFPPAWADCERAKEIRSSLLTILEHHFRTAAPLAGVKDPRMCRLMPLWFPVFKTLGIEPRFVLIARHPWEVAQSLAKRDGIDQTKSYLLWLQHVLDAERATRFEERSFLTYERLIEDPAAVLSRVRKELKLDIDPPSRARGRLRNFLEASLRHHVASVQNAASVPPPVKEVYKALCDARTSGDIAVAIPPLCLKCKQGAELIYSRLKAQETEQAVEKCRLKMDGGNTRIQVFAIKDGITSENFSSRMEVAQGRWCHLKIALPWGLGDGTGPLRIDPSDRAGILYLAGISIRSAITKRILWRATGRRGLKRLRIGGTAFRLPHSRLLWLISYDEDPQIYLPHLSGPRFEEPLVLGVWLRFDARAEAMQSAANAWNEAASRAGEPATKRIALSFGRRASKSTDKPSSLSIYSPEETTGTG